MIKWTSIESVMVGEFDGMSNFVFGTKTKGWSVSEEWNDEGTIIY